MVGQLGEKLKRNEDKAQDGAFLSSINILGASLIHLGLEQHLKDTEAASVLHLQLRI